MLEAFKAVLGITAILGGWITVQAIWRHVTGASPCQDALAGRIGCQTCECHSPTKDKSDAPLNLRKTTTN